MRSEDKPNRIRQGIGKFAPTEIFKRFSHCAKINMSGFLTHGWRTTYALMSRLPSWHTPHTYGMKFWVIFEVASKFISNIVPYVGAQEKDERDGVPLAELGVMKLSQHIIGKGYNSTCKIFCFPYVLVFSRKACKRKDFGCGIDENCRKKWKVRKEEVNFQSFLLGQKLWRTSCKYQIQVKKINVGINTHRSVIKCGVH